MVEKAGREAIILAAGDGTRLGNGPKAFLELNGRTLLEHAVELGARVAERVIAAAPPGQTEVAQELLGDGILVTDGGANRGETMRKLIGLARGSTIVVLDVVHPLTSLDLCRRVIEAAGRDGAAVGVGRSHDQLIDADGRGVVPSGEVYSLKKPMVFPRRALLDGLGIAARRDPAAAASLGVIELLRQAGLRVATVEGEPWNVKLTTPTDWEMIQALAPHYLAMPAETARRG